MKIVINNCYGGFGLSELAYNHLGLEWDEYGYAFMDHDERNNPALIACVEQLGKKASGQHADLTIVEIPDGVSFYIDGYDGIESVHENHRVWS